MIEIRENELNIFTIVTLKPVKPLCDSVFFVKLSGIAFTQRHTKNT